MKFLHQNCVQKLSQSFLKISHDTWFSRQMQNTLKITTLRQNHSSAGEKTFFGIVKKQGGRFRSVLSRSTLTNLLLNCKSVQEQIEVFHSYVRLTKDDYASRESICKSIDKVFKSIFPDSTMCLIGSSASGIGLRGCDLDLSLQLQNQNANQVCASQVLVISNIDVASGKVPKSDFFLLPNKQQLIFLKKIIIESGLVENATIIPGRFPILNFTCDNLGCDLSINNRSGILATNLIQFCNKSDSRVAPLCQLITYWGRQLKLMGGPLKFKSYAVFLLVVYFLQTRHPVVFPPLQDILQEIELQEHVDSKYYNTQYSRKVYHSNNTESLGDLLREFFFFYANFDFSSVICPMEVKLVDGKSMILKDPEFELNTVSIQDPFNSSLNVTTGVDWKHCKSFIGSLLSTCDAFHENPQQQSTEKNWGLLSLLDNTSAGYSFTERELVEIKVPLTFNNDSDDTRIECLNQAIDKVFKIFKDCLLFQSDICKSDYDLLNRTKIEYVTSASEKFKKRNRKNKSDKNKRTNDDSEKVLISRTICVKSSDAWFGRSNYDYLYSAGNEIEFLEYEKQISKTILQNRTRNEKNEFIFLCECSGVHTNRKTYLKVTLKPLNRDVFIPKLGIFLKEYLYKYAIKYL